MEEPKFLPESEDHFSVFRDENYESIKNDDIEDLLIPCIKTEQYKMHSMKHKQLSHSPRPLTSPKQIEDLGILFGQLSPSKKPCSYVNHNGQFSSNSFKSKLFPISPRPPHGNKRRYASQNKTSLLSSLYPKLQTANGSTGTSRKMYPTSVGKGNEENNCLYVEDRNQLHDYAAKESFEALSKNLSDYSYQTYDRDEGRDISFSNDEINFLGNLLLDRPRSNRSTLNEKLHIKSEALFPSISQATNETTSRETKQNLQRKSSKSQPKVKPRKNKRSTWTPEEDRRLKEEVQLRANKRYYGMWKEIAASIGGRHTHKECHDRYTKNLDPNLNKGRWKKEEDEHLRHLLSLPDMKSENGEYKWPAIARKLKRCPKQVREHFQNSVDPHLTKRRQPWSVKQVLCLKALMEEMETQGRGRRWKEIAAEFPGRSVDAVRAKGLSVLESEKTEAAKEVSSEEPRSEVPNVKTELVNFDEMSDFHGYY